MPTITRRGVFETNSSSTHSVAIDERTNVDYKMIHPDLDGVLHMGGPMNFGWEWEILDDPVSLAWYLRIIARDWCRGYSTDSEEILETLDTMLKKHTGAVTVVWGESNTWMGDGWIDHQAVEDRAFTELVTSGPDMMRRFVFGTKSELRTGNDNQVSPNDGLDWFPESSAGRRVITGGWER